MVRPLRLGPGRDARRRAAQPRRGPACPQLTTSAGPPPALTAARLVGPDRVPAATLMIRRDGVAEGRCTYRAPVFGRRDTGATAVMTSSSVDVIRWGRERARTWPWRGDATVAFLAPVPEAPILSAAFLGRCLTILGERGFARVVTSALSPMEQMGFLAAGFEVAEELHLLSLELDGLPPRPAVAVTRVTAAGRPHVLAIDRVAFPPFWQLDEHGLDEALGATPRSRFRGVVGGDGRTLIGYAIHGRSGARGFVQRLAVAPEARRQKIGRGLLLDGLYWMRRRGVRRAVVNTQVGNDAALSLYYDTGFSREPSGLSVMEAGLR